MRLIDADSLLDRIERLLKESETIFGYEIQDLIFLAEACREAGITNEQIKDFRMDFETAYRMVQKTYHRQMQKYVESILDRMSDTERSEE